MAGSKNMSTNVQIESHVPVIDRILTAAPASVCRSQLDLVQFPSSTSCEKALLALNRANITGAPVYREMSTSTAVGVAVRGSCDRAQLSWRQTSVVLFCRFQAASETPLVLDKVVYTGFVDVADISVLMLTKGLKRAPAKGLVGKVASFFRPDVEHQVDHAMNLSGLDPFRWVHMTANLKEVRTVIWCCSA